VLAVTSAPVVLRACLDQSTGMVTVYMKPTTDPCGSFVRYRLYGRDDIANPYQWLADGASISAVQIATILPNKKKWQLFVTVMYACNGKDTFNSNAVFIDDTPPSYLEPDSVSVDFATQQLRAGWSASPEPDVMGYSIFKVDPITGNNQLIDEQNTLTYLFPNSTFNTSSGGNKVALAPYDSCRNGAVISNFHSPMLLSYSMAGANANYLCTRKFTFTWTTYVGWNTDHSDIWVNDNTLGTRSLAGTVATGVTSFTWNIPFFNHNYTFFIRAHSTKTGISSSSNTIIVAFPGFPIPSYNTIGHVTVLSNSDIQVSGKWDTPIPGMKAVLERSDNLGFTWNFVQTYAYPTNYFWITQNGLQTNKQRYLFRILLYNTCNEPFDTSVIHSSILLTRNMFVSMWNTYYPWSPKLDEEPLLRQKSSSTWNRLNIAPDTTIIHIDTTKPECYRIEAFKIGVNSKPIDTAYSNVICLQARDTTLIPSGFSPGGINPIFKISNPNLQKGQSTMKIFDRWGEKLWEGDALDGWDGKDNAGYYMGPGVAIYLVETRTIEKRETYKGTVIIVR
jgi:hypothetical protein